MPFEPSGEPGEDRMREATLVLAQYLDLIAATATQAAARPWTAKGVRGVDVIAAIHKGRNGGQETGLAHVPALLSELGMTVPARTGDRPWNVPSLPHGTFFSAADSPLWTIGSREQRLRFAELAADPAIDARLRQAALHLVPPEQFAPPTRERLAAALETATASPRGSRARGVVDNEAVEELTTLATDFAAERLARHLEWTSAQLKSQVEQPTTYRITHAVAEELDGVYAHHRYATTWCDQLLRPVDAREIAGPFEAARLALARPPAGQDEPAASEPTEGPTPPGAKRGRGRPSQSGRSRRRRASE